MLNYTWTSIWLSDFVAFVACLCMCIHKRICCYFSYAHIDNSIMTAY